MLVMPILNKSKNGTAKIYNVQISLKNASKVKEGIILKGYNESDIIINGTSFNNSIYDKKGIDPNVTVNFLRNYNYRAGKKNFLITTKEGADSTVYDLYKVDMPPRKITAGLDNLFGSAILDMKKEMPGSTKGRYVSLKKLGVDKHITEEKILKLKNIITNEKDDERKNNLMQLNGVSDLAKTIDYMRKFDCTIISEATILEEQLDLMINTLSKTYSKDARSLEKYYSMAKDNKEVYAKLTKISKIVYGKPINLIRSNPKQKILIKTKEETTNAA